jgi:hypothetical protein
MTAHITPRVGLALLFATLLAPGAVGAQSAEVRQLLLAPGTLVRFESSKAGGRRVGRVIDYTADTLRVDVGGTASTFAMRELGSLEVSQGRHRSMMRSASLGLFAGSLTGALVGAFAYKSSCGASSCPAEVDTREVQTAFIGVAGGGVGLAVGALVGSRPRERWRRLPVDPAVRVGVAPTADRGVRIAMHASF